ncbi:MAG: hypothetical protein IKZ23_04445, partial [Clostridia bacterium]|nr:hypothetical protein [Clostridia bacterium]
MLKKLAKSIKGFKTHAILSPLLIMGEVVMEVLIPLLIALLIDKGINAGTESPTGISAFFDKIAASIAPQGGIGYICAIGLLIAVCAVISLISGALAGRSAAIASTGFAKNLRERLFNRVSDFSFRNIDKFSTSSLITRMTTDVNRLQDTFHMFIRIAVRSPAMVIFSLVAAFGVNPKLALIFLGAVPVLLVGLWIITVKAHPVFKRMFKKYDKLNRVV